jgi:GT2 family glycosyltransferase
MKLAVIVLSWNGIDELPACLEALSAQSYQNAELLVIDNGSIDGSPRFVLEHFPQIHLIQNTHNLGFSGGMNVGLRLLSERAAPPDAIVLLNQDTIVEPDWLEQLAQSFERNPQAAAIGCKIYYPDGQTIQHAGVWIERGRAITRHYGYGEFDTGRYDTPRSLESVTGAALGLRTSALREVGFFDEGYNPAYYEETDLCWRLRRAGYTVLYEPKARLRHAESTSSGDPIRRLTLVNRNRLRFVFKTFEDERFWDEFVVAERVRIAQVANFQEWRFLGRAYLEGMLASEEWLAARVQFYPLSSSQAHAMRQVCHTFRSELQQAFRQANPQVLL